MNFLIDQDVYYTTILLLKEWKHDVITASELGMSRSGDEELFYFLLLNQIVTG